MPLPQFLSLNPVARKRLRRFRQLRRAWLSLWLLAGLYAVSLCAELVANDVPLLVRTGDGRLLLPVFAHYSSDELTGDGSPLAPDYRALDASPAFAAAGGWMLWPPFRSGPNSQVPSEELAPYRRAQVRLTPVPGVATAAIDDHLAILSLDGGDSLMTPPPHGWTAHRLDDLWSLPDDLRQAVATRLDNQPAPEAEFACAGRDGAPDVTIRLLASRPRRRPPSRVILKLLEADATRSARVLAWRFRRGEDTPEHDADTLAALPPPVRDQVLAAVRDTFADSQSAAEETVAGSRRYGGSAEQPAHGATTLEIAGRPHTLSCELERVEHPFRPVPGHRLGLDDAGRDVLARILYGLRTSLTFGLVLVISSMMFGTLFGCLQGYLGGCVDLLGQRAIEIWSALPFLYIVILMGSLFGTGFWLLLVCYALFNWIGVSYYMRAEMLRLRRQPFVEAARCLGLPWWLIVLRHILPNALVPLVTFVPFSLVGAIGSLAGLDYLGFGLPPPTPSLGQLLQQAQVQREAWWLIAYPSGALFVVMLLCVFIGEGVREAFDPRRQSRIR